MTPEDYAVADRVAARFEGWYVTRERAAGVAVVKWPPGDVLLRLSTIHDERAEHLMARAQWARFVPRGARGELERRNLAEVNAAPLQLLDFHGRGLLWMGGRLPAEQLMR